MAMFWIGIKEFLFAFFFGNLCGAIGWSFRTLAADLRYTVSNPLEDAVAKSSVSNRARDYYLQSQVYASYAPYYPFRGVEFVCLCTSIIMVLHRLLNHVLFSQSTSKNNISRTQQHKTALSFLFQLPKTDIRPLLLFKIAALVVLCLSVAGVCCGLADSVFYNAQRDFMQSASNAVNSTTGDDTPQSLTFIRYSEAAGMFQADARSAQHFCEVISLYTLIIMFVAVGRASFSAMNASLEKLDIANASVSLLSPHDVKSKLKTNSNHEMKAHEFDEAKAMAHAIVGSSKKTLEFQLSRLVAALFFVPFLGLFPRAIYGVMVLISGYEVSQSDQCPPCATCQSLGALIHGFDIRSPEMQNICIAMSTPLAMIVCMFLMITRKERRRLLNSRFFEEDDVEKGATIMSSKLGIELLRGK